MNFLPLLLGASLLLVLSTGYGQDKTIINKSGKVTMLSFKDDQINVIDICALKNHNADLKKHHRDATAKLIKATLANLKNQRNNLRIFYEWIWGNAEVDNLEKDLKALEGYLANKDISVLALHDLTTLKTSIDKHLFNGESFENLTKSAQNLQLWKTDLFKTFLIEYYNNCYTNATDAIKDYGLDDLLRDSRYLDEQYEASSKVLAEMRNGPEQVSAATLQNLQNFHSRLNGGRLTAIKNDLLKEKWFKQWIWINGGSLRLNPLKFSTNEYLGKFSSVDKLKSGIYEQYLDSLAARYIRYDSTERIESFRKILAEKGTGNNKYALSNRADADKNNQNEMQALLMTSSLVNDIFIPESKSCASKTGTERTKCVKDHPVEFQNFSFSEKDIFQASAETKNYTTRPVRAGTEKILVVHNIPAAYMLEIQEKTTTINDRSDVQTGIDSLISFATQLSALAVSFSPYGAYLTPKQLISTRSISMAALQAEHQQKSLSVSPGERTLKPSVSEYLQIILEKNGRFDQTVFQEALTKMPSDFDPDAEYMDRPAQRNEAAIFLTFYEAAFTQALKAAVDNVQKDSLYLSHLSAAFSESTLPPSELEPIKNTKAIFYSKILHTKPSDEPVKHEISIIGKNEKDAKDSVIVSSFKFKTGKTYRFQLSAGIAYTFSKFSQTSAQEKDGEILITNTAQQYRFLVGMHVHWGKGLFVQDNRLFGNFWERSAAFIGVGIPKPMENVYLGYSYDFFPGLKTTLGTQFIRNNKYFIQNNQILDERIRYQLTGPFLAIQIDPTGLLNALTLLFKKV